MTDENEFEITEKIKDICFLARKSWFTLSNSSTDQRNNIIKKIIDVVQKEKPIIFAANEKDISLAKENNLSSAMIDRLTINEKRIQGITQSLEEIIKLPDPLGKVLSNNKKDNGLEISKITVPIGVIGLIFESRPNVTIEAAALAIKSGNSIILKGGKEAFFTNQAFSEVISKAFSELNLDSDCVQIVPFKERSATMTLLKQDDTVDLIIPRGGEGLIRFVTENSLIPVIKHYKGLCHTYIHKDADLEKAVSISVNAKVQRPGVCNAMETLLIDEDISNDFLPHLIEQFKTHGVDLKGCEKVCSIDSSIEEASEDDWDTEYLSKTLSIKVVESIQEAISHIEKHGSRHSEAIITENKLAAAQFVQNIDASAVFVNASTRFNDGFEFGLGAEMGISTDKLHARGPMGIQEMTTYKYVVVGDGHIRE